MNIHIQIQTGLKKAIPLQHYWGRNSISCNEHLNNSVIYNRSQIAVYFVNDLTRTDENVIYFYGVGVLS